ncbi:MAG: hypothetical protein M5U22_18735 [Thermoleophilia bacterium]|nr:hypothetical protein [Thermoleophilia bacterium]
MLEYQQVMWHRAVALNEGAGGVEPGVARVHGPPVHNNGNRQLLSGRE